MATASARFAPGSHVVVAVRPGAVTLGAPDAADANRLTARVAVLSTSISLVLGTLSVIAVVKGRVPGSAAIATFMVSPLMLPGLVLGIALLQAMREFGLRDAWVSLLLAHVVITMPSCCARCWQA